jgi:hypothetical protein
MGRLHGHTRGGCGLWRPKRYSCAMVAPIRVHHDGVGRNHRRRSYRLRRHHHSLQPCGGQNRLWDVDGRRLCPAFSFGGRHAGGGDGFRIGREAGRVALFDCGHVSFLSRKWTLRGRCQSVGRVPFSKEKGPLSQYPSRRMAGRIDHRRAGLVFHVQRRGACFVEDSNVPLPHSRGSLRHHALRSEVSEIRGARTRRQVHRHAQGTWLFRRVDPLLPFVNMVQRHGRRPWTSRLRGLGGRNGFAPCIRGGDKVFARLFSNDPAAAGPLDAGIRRTGY